MAEQDHPIPFNSGTEEIIFENGTLQFVIYKREFERQERYALDDFLFHVLIRLKPGRRYPRLVDMCTPIEDSVYAVLVKLREYYSLPGVADDEHDIETHITIAENNLDHGLQIGNFSLSENLKTVANYTATRLWDFLKSGYIPINLQCNESFQIFFKCLSVEHLREKLGLNPEFMVNRIGDLLRWHRRRIFPTPTDRVGGSVGGERRNCKYLLATPQGYKKNAQAFSNECLLLCLLLGRENNAVLEDRPPPADKSSLSVQNYIKCLKNKPMSTMAGQNLLHKLNELKKSLGLMATTGPRDIQLCAKVAAKWNCQIAVFNSSSPPAIEMTFPHRFDLSRPPIFILQSSDNNSDCSHFDLIRNIRTFYNVRGFACVGAACKYQTRCYGNLRHRCRSTNCKACSSCHRTLMKKDTYVNENLAPLYCDSEVNQDLMECCQECNLMLQSTSCRKAHVGSFCRAKGKWCSHCARHVKQSHSCAPLCHNCWGVKETDHQCEVARPPQLQFLPNVAFVSCESTSSKARCLSCYELEKREQTDSCKDHVHHGVVTQPTCLSVLFEQDQHEVFSRITFFDGGVGQREEKHVLSFPYLDTNADPSLKQLSRDRRVGRYGKPREGKNIALDETLTALSEKKSKSPVEQFLAYFVSPAFQNFTFVVSDFDAMTYLVRGVTSCNMTPTNAVHKGNRTVHFSVSFDIRFVCSPQYIAGDMLQRMRQFGLDFPLTFFPDNLWHHFKSTNFEPVDAIPDFGHFVDLGDSREMWQEKRRHWEEMNRAGGKWSPIEQLYSASTSHLQVLALSGLNFLKTAMTLQQQCLTQFGDPPHLKKDRLKFIHPFSCYNGSLPSFMFATFRHFAMKSNMLYAIDNEYGHTIQTSVGELQTTEFLRSRHKGAWVTAFSSTEGQKKFFLQNGKLLCIADAWNKITGVAFFYNGCRWHGHGCKLSGKCQESSKKRREDFEEKMRKLLLHFPHEVRKVLVLYECDWLKIRRQTPEIAEFLKEPTMRCLPRLRVRDAYKGALTECFALKFIAKEEDDDDFFVLDVASLFSHITLKYPMPIGRSRTILGDDLLQSEIEMRADGFYYKSRRCYGVCQVIIFPPAQCIRPKLFTTIDGKYIGFLCRTCATKGKRGGRNLLPCQHNDRERSFTDVYTTEELHFAAVEHSYRYFFLEITIYHEASFFLRDFVTRLAFSKIKHSEFPPGICTREEKEKYLEEIESKMHFRDILKESLTVEAIEPCAEKRAFFKQCLNSLIGAFGVNTEKARNSEYISNARQLYDYHKTGQVTQIHSLGNVLRLVLKADTRRTNRRACVIVSIFVTSLARVEMMRHMDSIERCGGTMFRISCDSLYFTFKKGVPLPFCLSEAFGDFKKTYQRVRGFVQVGASSTSTIYEEDGQLKTDTRVCGLNLKNVLCGKLTFEKLTGILDQAIVDELFNVKCEDFKVDSLRTLHSNMNVAKVRSKRTVSGKNIFERRQIDYLDPNLRTYPFGYRPV